MIDLKKIGIEEQASLQPNRDYCFIVRDDKNIRKLTVDEAKEILELLWQYSNLRNS